MRVKEMFLKKISISIFFFTLLLSKANANELKNEEIDKIIQYLINVNNFSVSFIQNDNINISEGKIYIGNKRVRINYEKPSNIIIILDKKKAMYYNYDLDEVEFFNTSNTSAWFFFEIFKNPEIMRDAKYTEEDNYILLQKKGSNDIGNYILEISFENNPLLIRKISLNLNEDKFTLSLNGHTTNEKFSRNFFKLINPSFFK